ncbi:Arc family DNA-binding protein [Duganella sp. FT94W]|uniref:Arc family DNA-binding protein n=1 Tax=Duganella lactea TaxID=2692173 RepID=A0ABW9V813_9BURK|nr:Arc family DNA-binding protein [Duganella lactea]MYM34897.1 Arc family DNA-binding protein [Duganella lactea]
MSFDIKKQQSATMSRIIARMTDSKKPKETHQTSVRLPHPLHAELKAVAESKGWSINDEINFRLRAFALHEQMLAVASDVTDIKSMVRRIADSK